MSIGDDFRFEENKYPHAMILESVSLEKMWQKALYISKKLLCTSEGDKPCGKCDACIKVEKNVHPDLKVISPTKDTKFIKIDEVRSVRKDAYVTANEGKYKIYIFNPAESLTVQAQNAFIKILEEPPKNVVFVLMCRSSSALLDTLLSRCEIFSFNEKSYENYKSEIKNICEEVLNLSFQNKKLEVVKVLSKLPSDRSYLREFLLCLMETLIDFIKNSENSISLDCVSKKIDNLKFCLKLIDRNVNMNIIITMIGISI